MPRTADRFSCNLNEKRKNHSGFYTTYGFFNMAKTKLLKLI